MMIKGRRIPVKAGIFSRCSYVLMWVLLTPAVTAFSGYSFAGESEAEICAAFVDYPALYDDCTQNSSNIVDQDSTFAISEDGQDTCYCDVRKKQQVEKRMQKKAVQDAEQNRMLFGDHDRPR